MAPRETLLSDACFIGAYAYLTYGDYCYSLL